MSLNQNRQVLERPTIPRGRTLSLPTRILQKKAPVSLDCSDIRKEKVSRAKKLIARSDYPSKKVIRSVANLIARYF